MTVVVGYLPTPEGSAAVDHAMAEAKLTSARVVVVNTGHHGDFSHPDFATAQDMDTLDRQLTTAGIEHEVRHDTGSSSASEAILNAATETSADLIVIGIRRRSPVGKLFAGSTAQEVLLDADCPVLAVKPR
ncbi:universal stress protein [Lapillicoccus sp.]|uniref:universal stress protein n=1 Tax=Lapillicoccus sp. TaxID=1909287 RepID=UPI0032638328